MEGAVVRLLVVSSGIVRVAWALTPLGKETPNIIVRAEKI
ncbi:Bgt-55103 [Blumeria graminis f. sp. tritici]|uniref:Bgt-55103 n=1 Tax=Blumeria graminis f. sp. tritici TaxID=62690 RepID=A0A9X9L7W1_BLUGR|nr:Bgt-55103 [Blumeria graminis f. sp. tritici]